MARMYYSARRNLALLICPEMGVEARLKAMRETFAADGQGKPEPDYTPFMDALFADCNRPEQPCLDSCYRRAVRLAEANGWAFPFYADARRRLAKMAGV